MKPKKPAKKKKKENKFSLYWKKWRTKPGKPWGTAPGIEARWRVLLDDIITDYCRKHRIRGKLREALLDLSYDNKGMRLSAIQDLLTLPKHQAAKAVPLLRILLKKDTDPTTRETAATHLGYLGAKVAVPDLIHALEHEAHHGVAAGAASGLGKIKDKRAVPALLKAITSTGDIYQDFQRRQSNLYRYAANALGEIAPKLVKGKLAVAKINLISERMRNFSMEKRGLIKYLVATDASLRAKLPSSLADKRQRDKIDYLHNFVTQAGEHSFEEMLEIFGFAKGVKK